MEERRIIFPQETHLSTQGHEKLKTYGYNNTFYSSFKQSYRGGLATLIRTFEINKEIYHREGSVRIVEIHLLLSNRNTSMYTRMHSDTQTHTHTNIHTYAHKHADTLSDSCTPARHKYKKWTSYIVLKWFWNISKLCLLLYVCHNYSKRMLKRDWNKCNED